MKGKEKGGDRLVLRNCKYNREKLKILCISNSVISFIQYHFTFTDFNSVGADPQTLFIKQPPLTKLHC